jgi:hypothetical protein
LRSAPAVSWFFMLGVLSSSSVPPSARWAGSRCLFGMSALDMCKPCMVLRNCFALPLQATGGMGGRPASFWATQTLNEPVSRNGGPDGGC